MLNTMPFADAASKTASTTVQDAVIDFLMNKNVPVYVAQEIVQKIKKPNEASYWEMDTDNKNLGIALIVFKERARARAHELFPGNLRLHCPVAAKEQSRPAIHI